MDVYVLDFHGTLTKGYELEYSFYNKILRNKDLRIRGELFLKLIKMKIKKETSSVDNVYDIMEECLNASYISDEDVVQAIKSSAKKFSLNEDVEKFLKSSCEKFIITRGVEDIIKEALQKYKIDVYGNRLYKKNGKWYIERKIIKPEDKLIKLKEILRKYKGEKYKDENITTVVLGNGKADIEILKFADIPVATFNAIGSIKKLVKERNGIMLKKGNFHEILNLRMD